MSNINVICVGFGRTGTSSLSLAIKELGFDCHHMFDAIQFRNFDLWLKAWKEKQEGKTETLQKILANYQAVSGWPASAFYKELLMLNPKAKVILTIRDPDSWYTSCSDTIASSELRIPWMAEMFIFPRMNECLDSIVWNGTFNGKFNDKEYAISVYKQHIEEVKACVPADRLLVVHIKEGYKPICDFLSVPIPYTPFPHSNDKEQFQKYLGGCKNIAFITYSIILVLTLLILAYVTSLIYLK
ncbi:hypothetical protein HDV04_003180 [Boothiomyces sp. JEL0838]|nr:hypothetical protein HDV04_003180 [Boothiomyces sp. JEL0838]